MTTSIGTLSAKLTMNSEEFVSHSKRAFDEMIRLETAGERTQHAIRKTSTAAAEEIRRSSNLWQRGALELSRGVEDFAAVFATSGLSGGLRASSNNLSQFAAIMNPAAGAVVGLSVALGTMLLPYLTDTETAAKKAADEIDKLADAQQKLIEKENQRAVESARNEERIAQARKHAAQGTEESAKKQAEQLREQADITHAEIEAIKKRDAELAKEEAMIRARTQDAELRKQQERQSSVLPFGFREQGATKEDQARLKAIEDERSQMRDEIQKGERQRNMLREQARGVDSVTPEARSNEQRKKALEETRKQEEKIAAERKRAEEELAAFRFREIAKQVENEEKNAEKKRKEREDAYRDNNAGKFSIMERGSQSAFAFLNKNLTMEQRQEQANKYLADIARATQEQLRESKKNKAQIGQAKI